MHFDRVSLALAALAQADGFSFAVSADELDGAIALRIFGNAGHGVIFRLVLLCEPSGSPKVPAARCFDTGLNRSRKLQSEIRPG